MDKVLFQSARTEEERVQCLQDNCNSIEKVTYNKSYPVEEVEEMREQLVRNAINLKAVKAEKKEVMKSYSDRIKAIETSTDNLTESLVSGSRIVEEDCYKFVDYDERVVGYYNRAGELVKQRPARKNELQKTIYRELNGTND